MKEYSDFYSSSYGGTEENYYIKIKTDQNEFDEKIDGLLCVVQNILQRGKKTKPSEYLQEKLGVMECPSVLISPREETIWLNIKGDNYRGNNPAREFFEEKLFEGAQNYGFTKSLFLPEASLMDILINENMDYDEACSFKDQSVDFCLPQAKLVIEMDGYQHKEASQREKDTLRDRALRKAGYKVYRINTNDFSAENETYKKTFNEIRKHISTNDTIKQYRDSQEIHLNDLRVQYDAIMRLQMALLAAMRKGMISLSENKFELYIEYTDLPELNKLIHYAYEDLCSWIHHINNLIKIEYLSIPELEIVSEHTKDAIILDFSMCDRYTDVSSRIKNNSIYIRTAYFNDVDHYRVSSSTPLLYQFREADKEKEMNSFSFLLKNVFGLKEFRRGQIDIIKNALERRDTIGILPTGTGKSLCYQVVALLQPGITIVVVPITALMNDQVQSLENKNIDHIGYINSTLEVNEKSRFLYLLKSGKYQIVFISPERVQRPDFKDILTGLEENNAIPNVIIDEVHCLSEWGHDFRVSYLCLIPVMRNCLYNTRFLGLTATASQAVLSDLKAEFGIDSFDIKALASMDRKELSFHRILIKNNQERLQKVSEIINGNRDNRKLGTTENHYPPVGILFCPTKNAPKSRQSYQYCCSGVKEYVAVQHKLMDSLLYHGGLSSKEKNDNQQKFMEQSFDGVMICTKSFGMGIDKPNVKYTIHLTIPASIEAFYQEAGRAGRDANKDIQSNCYIVCQIPDSKEKNIIKKIFSNDTDIEERRKNLREIESDLQTPLYLWLSEKFNVEDDVFYTMKVYKCIQIDSCIKWEDSQKKKRKEEALYRLKILGVIDSWTVSYTQGLSKGTLNVIPLITKEKDIKETLLTYIRKYDKEFTLNAKLKRYEEYKRIMDGDGSMILKCIHILRLWTEKNILMNQLTSLYNMHMLCSQDVSDEEFRRQINDYFKYTEESIVIENIVEDPLNFEIWFNMLYINKFGADKVLIDREQAKSMLPSLARYLESYNGNTGLNYLNAMLRCIANSFIGTEGEWRLTDALRMIKESFTEDDQEIILEYTLDILEKSSMEIKNICSQIILEIYGGKEFLVYSKIKDQYSLAKIIKRYTFDIEKEVGRVL